MRVRTPRADFFSETISNLTGVGPRVAFRLKKLGITRVQDLLFHLPQRYQDRTQVAPIGGLRAGMEAVVEGEIAHAEMVYRRRRMLLVMLTDGTGDVMLRFFHFKPAQQQAFRRGTRLRCFGEVRMGAGSREMVHPEYRLLNAAAPAPVEAHLTPIYPATEGLHQLTLRKLVDQALACLNSSSLTDWLPAEYQRDSSFPLLHEALRFVHHPPPDAELDLLAEGRHPAQRRLAFEELLAHQLSLARRRATTRGQTAPTIDVPGERCRMFLRRLPFQLTAAQYRVIGEISDDLAQPHPMLRLVQGDVGSGKTVVAAASCLYAVEAGYQTAVMAPTELLAEQHYRNFADWLEPLDLKVAWLSGKFKTRARRDMLAMIGNGEAAVAVGTHALFQEGVAFHDLALVVIDEQHRFGVHQRLALREKGQREGRQPHQLIMTATPIPRTLAMTAYADLDYSVIDELPPGRTPVMTAAVTDNRRAEVVERVARACGEGRQAYWVCTLIEESEILQAQAAEETARELQEALTGLRIGLAHGRMKAREKEAVMARFKAGGIDLLVATTVIEVGVDVPNASLMIIENAERLGLAQIHQLRGRVGRGRHESCCVLMYRPPLSGFAKQRLEALRRTTDGFEIARVDLGLRGPGEVLGTRQTGLMQMRIADLMRDQDLLPKAQDMARSMLKQCPQHVEPLISRWLGESERFGQV